MQFPQETQITKVIADIAEQFGSHSDSELWTQISKEANNPTEQSAIILSQLLLREKVPEFIQARLTLKGIEMEVTESLEDESCWCDYVIGLNTYRVRGRTHGKRWYIATTGSIKTIGLLAHMGLEQKRLEAMHLPEASGLLTLLINHSDTIKLCPTAHRSTVSHSVSSETCRSILISRNNTIEPHNTTWEEATENLESKDELSREFREFHEKLKEGSIDSEAFHQIKSPHYYYLTKITSVTICYESQNDSLEFNLPIDTSSYAQHLEELGLIVVPKGISKDQGHGNGAKILLQLELGIPFAHGFYEDIEIPDNLLKESAISSEHVNNAFKEHPVWAEARLDEFVDLLRDKAHEASDNPHIGNRLDLQILISETDSSPLFLSVQCWGRDLDCGQPSSTYQPDIFTVPLGSRWIQLDDFIELLEKDHGWQRRFIYALLKMHEGSEELVVSIKGLASSPILLNNTGCALCGNIVPRLILSQCLMVDESSYIGFSQSYSYGELDTGLYTTSSEEPGSVNRYACRLSPSSDLVWDLR